MEEKYHEKTTARREAALGDCAAAERRLRVGASMKFIREIPFALVKQTQIDTLHQFGFTLIWREDSVEVWAS